MLPSFTTLTEKVPLIRSLRYTGFRLYWLGMVATTLGSQMRQVAMLWLVYQLTGSAMDLGIVGGVEGVSSIVFTFIGGAMADRLDRRRLLLLTNSSLLVLMFALAAFTAAGLTRMPHLLVFAFLFGAITSIDGPTRQALYPNLVEDKKDLMNAIALHSTLHQVSRIVGPAIAGLLSAFNLSISFFVASAAYLVMVINISRIKAPEGQATTASHRTGFRGSPWEGLSYVLRNPIFSAVIGLVLLNSVFGMSFTYLLPVFAGDVLGVDSKGYGFLITFLGVGTLAGVLLGAMLGSFKKKHILLLGGSGLFGLLLIVFSTSGNYYTAAIAIALAGFAQHLYMLTAHTLVQYLVPDEVRGRVMAIYSMVWSLTPLGGLQAGAVASYTDTPTAIAVGGAVVAGFAVFLLACVPRLRKIDV